MSERSGENIDLTENPDPESEGGAARGDDDHVNDAGEAEQQSEDPEDVDRSQRNDLGGPVNNVQGLAHPSLEGSEDHHVVNDNDQAGDLAIARGLGIQPDNPEDHHVVIDNWEDGDVAIAHGVGLQSEDPEDSSPRLTEQLSERGLSAGDGQYGLLDLVPQSEEPEGLMDGNVPLHSGQSDEPEDSTESIGFYTEASTNNSCQGQVNGFLEDDSTEDDKEGVNVIQPERELQLPVSAAEECPGLVLDSPASDTSPNLDTRPEVERTEDDPDRLDLLPQNDHAEDDLQEEISRCVAMASVPDVLGTRSNLVDGTESDHGNLFHHEEDNEGKFGGGGGLEFGEAAGSSHSSAEGVGDRLQTESNGCAIAGDIRPDLGVEDIGLENNAVEADHGNGSKALSESDPEENTGSQGLSNDRIEADNSQGIMSVLEMESTQRLEAEGMQAASANNSDFLVSNGDMEGGHDWQRMDIGICNGGYDSGSCEEGEGTSANKEGEETIQCNLSGPGDGNLQLFIWGGEHHQNGEGLTVGGRPLGDTGELEDQPEDSGFSRRDGARPRDNVSEADLYAPECDRAQNCPEQADEDEQGQAEEVGYSLENLPDVVMADVIPDLVMADISPANSVDIIQVSPSSCAPSAEALSMQNLNLLPDHLCSGDVGNSLSEDFERSADVLQPDVLQQQHVNVSCDGSEDVVEEASSNFFPNMDLIRQSDLVSDHTCNVRENIPSISNLQPSNNSGGHMLQLDLPVSSANAATSPDISHDLSRDVSRDKRSEDSFSCSNSNSNSSLQCLPCSLSGTVVTENENTKTRHSTLEACSGNIAEDEDLLNELDAELHINNTEETNHLDRGDNSLVVISDRVTAATGDGLINGLRASSASCLSDVKLQQKLQQLLQKLADKDAKIERLEEEKSSQAEQLEFVIHEKDSYQKKFQNLQSKQSPDDLYLPQIKELEYMLTQQQNEIRSLKEKLTSHDAAAKRAVGALQHELKLRVDQVTKMYEDCRKEKDSMVVKYAQAESKNIELHRGTEAAEGKLRDILKEREMFLVKARALKADYTKTCAELESKNGELTATTRELDKQRELVSSAEVRIKWAQNKLKAELEAHKETKKEVDKSTAKIKESKEEAEQIRRDCQAIIKTYQECEEMKSNTLDQRLRKKESELLLEKREKTDQEEVHSIVLRELESLKIKHKDTLEELKTYKDKVRAQEAERLTNEHSMTKYKEIMQNQKKENKDLQAKIDKLFHTQTDFDRAQDTIKCIDADIRDLKLCNKELQAEIESFRKRETNLLELTEKLTGKNANLQSENTSLNGKVLKLTGDHQRMAMEIQEIDTQLKHTSDSLKEERKARKTETEKLEEALSEKSKSSEDTRIMVDELKDDIKTLKRKHANNIKDLTRQLQQARKRLESMEGHGENKESLSMGSRTSSNGSLNTTQGENNTPSASNSSVRQSTPESPPQEYPVIVDRVEIDRQVLIERIVKLQKAHARKNEKIEFMEDHIKQLITEVKKKKKIIENYVLREESGALSTEFMDRNKAELSKKGGIMASVYSSHASDGHMSLDLSLEINKKLQAVLEDTLLKNITLKENIDTLGEEIARLSQENRRLQLSIQGQNGS